MADRRFNKLAMLVKTEATYGTDPVPAVADAIISKNVSITPIEGEEVNRDLLLPYLGNQGTILTAMYGRVEFDVEIAGAGAAGSVPKYGSLLRAAGLAATVTAGTSVVYSIVEDAVESAALYFISDKVQHIFLGSQTNVAMNFVPNQIPSFRITMMGLLGTITDVGAMPAVNLTGWTTPVPVSKANTTFTLHGWAATAENVSIDLGNVLTPRMLIGDERILISDRKSTGSAVVAAKSLAEVDWFAKARSSARAAMTLQHGITPGNIVQVSAPAVQIGKPTQGQTNNIVNYTLPLQLCPNNGRDELTITVR